MAQEKLFRRYRSFTFSRIFCMGTTSNVVTELPMNSAKKRALSIEICQVASGWNDKLYSTYELYAWNM